MVDLSEDGVLRRNRLVQTAALSLLKLADGMASAALVLPWLAQSLGVPGAIIGLFVPVREAGALLPQMALARWVARAPRRASLWSLGAAAQGISALAIACSALFLNNLSAGIGMLAGLVVLSLARALCSVSHKDTLARSLPKGQRGRVTGWSTSLAAAGVLGFAGGLATGAIPLTSFAISMAIALAGAAWLAAGAVFAALVERGAPDAPAPDDRLGLGPLRSDPQLRLFLVIRALLTGTALAPPFILMLAGQHSESGLGALGPMVLASAMAAIVSGWAWGRLADRSSRRTLRTAAIGATLAIGLTAAIGQGHGDLGGPLGAAGALFAARLCYEGVRLARKLHVTDMTDDAHRAPHVALSNTVIGGVLLVGGTWGLVAELFGPAMVLALLAAQSALAAALASGLQEVQERT